MISFTRDSHRSASLRGLLAVLALLAALLSGCSSDPQPVSPAPNTDVGQDDGGEEGEEQEDQEEGGGEDG